MISHKDKFIFIHIPKCAGTSIERVLNPSDDTTFIMEPDHRSIRMIERPILLGPLISSFDNLFQFALRQRYALRRHKNPNNRLTVTSDQFEQYFKFTIVRNPWSRAYSWYKNCIRDPNHRVRFGLPENITLADFLKKTVGRGALRPQIAWLQNFGGTIPVDFIGRFESLNDDFQTICKELGLSQLRLPHDRNGNTQDYRAEYDTQSKYLVENAYRSEIELFGYSFEA